MIATAFDKLADQCAGITRAIRDGDPPDPFEISVIIRRLMKQRDMPTGDE